MASICHPLPAEIELSMLSMAVKFIPVVTASRFAGVCFQQSSRGSSQLRLDGLSELSAMHCFFGNCETYKALVKSLDASNRCAFELLACTPKRVLVHRLFNIECVGAAVNTSVLERQ